MKKNILYSVLAGLLFMASCAKKEKIGPDLAEMSGPVEFEESFTVNTTAPNFATGDKVYFTAKFKNDAYWVLTITGANSTAKKTFEGRGRFISASNVMWDGAADALPSFRAENAVATLSFPQASSVPAVTLSYNLAIGGKKNNDYGHVLVTDFSTNKIANSNFADTTLWNSDWGPTGVNNDLPLKNPDGTPYCSMGPIVPWQNNADFPGHKSPYLDLVLIRASSVGYPTYFPLIGNPSQIYFNIMVYNASVPSNTWLQVTLTEESPSSPSTIVAKSINIRPDWTGWKVVSVPYTDFMIGNGTTISNNPQKIKMIQLVLLSGDTQEVMDAASSPVSVAFDHIIFSHYKPYTP